MSSRKPAIRGNRPRDDVDDEVTLNIKFIEDESEAIDRSPIRHKRQIRDVVDVDDGDHVDDDETPAKISHTKKRARNIEQNVKKNSSVKPKPKLKSIAHVVEEDSDDEYVYETNYSVALNEEEQMDDTNNIKINHVEGQDDSVDLILRLNGDEAHAQINGDDGEHASDNDDMNEPNKDDNVKHEDDNQDADKRDAEPVKRRRGRPPRNPCALQPELAKPVVNDTTILISPRVQYRASHPTVVCLPHPDAKLSPVERLRKSLGGPSPDFIAPFTSENVIEYAKANNLELLPMDRPPPGKSFSDLQQILFGVLKTLKNKDYYNVFTEPVRVQDEPLYHLVVSHPMDLSTIEKELKKPNSKYVSLAVLRADVGLIIANCLYYNPDSGNFFNSKKLADSVLDAAEKRLLHHVAKGDDASSAVGSESARHHGRPFKGRVSFAPMDNERTNPELFDLGFGTNVKLSDLAVLYKPSNNNAPITPGPTPTIVLPTITSPLAIPIPDAVDESKSGGKKKRATPTKKQSIIDDQELLKTRQEAAIPHFVSADLNSLAYSWSFGENKRRKSEPDLAKLRKDDKYGAPPPSEDPVGEFEIWRQNRLRRRIVIPTARPKTNEQTSGFVCDSSLRRATLFYLNNISANNGEIRGKMEGSGYYRQHESDDVLYARDGTFVRCKISEDGHVSELEFEKNSNIKINRSYNEPPPMPTPYLSNSTHPRTVLSSSLHPDLSRYECTQTMISPVMTQNDTDHYDQICRGLLTDMVTIPSELCSCQPARPAQQRYASLDENPIDVALANNARMLKQFSSVMSDINTGTRDELGSKDIVSGV